MTASLDPGVIRRLADMHAVYRMHDAADRLLYIGRTGRAARFNEHDIKRWFPLVAKITLEWHDTPAQAVIAEQRAIATEKPRYNIRGRRVAPKPVKKTARRPEPAQPQLPPTLVDVLMVLGDAKGMHWEVIAERLAAKFPDRWADVTKDAISAQCRALGIMSVDVRYPAGRRGPNRKGCRRADIEQAASGRAPAG